ncbi:proline--tRNA ligase [Paenibacillus sediminis]|uniref:Proline--tRNA ligase n=1 Tax=Paenibacillus sediminis TaxID=664909 RepID=A0ABS4H195_9BACL|nr:proline--tRNA ligase [Paenibacillus sediminis]MBP1936294.1 prolyl-tRNA synthetase [Paenibacillus sediminis]
MRQSTLLSTTLRETPAEAEAASHQWLLRSGMIRQLAAGIYSYLPLGWRVLRKIENIIREEMDRAGAQEIFMPAMQPAELWVRSGRDERYGPELVRLQDRHNRPFVLGPTHEEVITTLVGGEVNSYRRLPMNVYQIQTKFRDERRPRFGLLRSREFLMMDAYSFDTDWEGLDKTYWQMVKAYRNIFTRVGLNFAAVEADPGAIGGEGGTHEFMALADIGEDTIAACSNCDYSANLEKAAAGPVLLSSANHEEGAVYEKIYSPQIKTIDELVTALNITARDIIKTLVYEADGQLIAVAVRGDHEVNEIKVKNTIGANELTLADAEVMKSHGLVLGFVGPIGLTIPLYIDHSVAQMTSAVTGANELDFHLLNVRPCRDFTMAHVGDYRNVVEGDSCPRCSGQLRLQRGIEIGHVFKLGTRYSETLGATFVDRNGKEQPMIMGCYGIGVSRLLSAIVEQHHDENGIVWPESIAPFQVHIIPVSMKDEAQMNLTEALYKSLVNQGYDVLVDDRDERVGVKLKDADMFGIPSRVVVGKKAAEGFVEFKKRQEQEASWIRVDEVIRRMTL